MITDADLDYRVVRTCEWCGRPGPAICRKCMGFEPVRVEIVVAPPPVVVAPPPKVKSPPKPRAPRKRLPRDRTRERTDYLRAVMGMASTVPDAEVDTAWAARPRERKPSPRGCNWPGCDNPHAMRGFCYRCVRRLPKLGVDGSDRDALPALWAAHMERVGDVFAQNGASRKGKRWARCEAAK